MLHNNHLYISHKWFHHNILHNNLNKQYMFQHYYKNQFNKQLIMCLKRRFLYKRLHFYYIQNWMGSNLNILNHFEVHMDQCKQYIHQLKLKLDQSMFIKYMRNNKDHCKHNIQNYLLSMNKKKTRNILYIQLLYQLQYLRMLIYYKFCNLDQHKPNKQEKQIHIFDVKNIHQYMLCIFRQYHMFYNFQFSKQNLYIKMYSQSYLLIIMILDSIISMQKMMHNINNFLQNIIKYKFMIHLHMNILQSILLNHIFLLRLLRKYHNQMSKQHNLKLNQILLQHILFSM